MSETHDHTASIAVALVSGAATFLDWAGGIGEKVVVAFLVAISSGVGYRLGTWMWQRAYDRWWKPS